MAIVNLKPLVDGHVLVCPYRVVPRFADLTPEEVQDLFLSVQVIGKKVEGWRKGQGLTISMQDGAAAGQTVSEKKESERGVYVHAPNNIYL